MLAVIFYPNIEEINPVTHLHSVFVLCMHLAMKLSH